MAKRKVWVLDTETKGTGAQVLPLEKALERTKPGDTSDRRPPKPRRPAAPRARAGARPRKAKRTATAWRTPLPAGHVRKTATGEIGRVLSVDAKAGTASVRWLRGGHTSTVSLAAVSRR